MVGEYSRFPTSSLLRSAVLSGIYRATHLDIEYLRHCSVDFNFDLINEKIWNNNWVITKITGNILPGEYVLLGSAIRGFSKKENFILTRCIQRIGNWTKKNWKKQKKDSSGPSRDSSSSSCLTPLSKTF